MVAMGELRDAGGCLRTTNNPNPNVKIQLVLCMTHYVQHCCHARLNFEDHEQQTRCLRWSAGSQRILPLLRIMTTVNEVGRCNIVNDTRQQFSNWKRNHDAEDDGNAMNGAHFGALYMTG